MKLNRLKFLLLLFAILTLIGSSYAALGLGSDLQIHHEAILLYWLSAGIVLFAVVSAIIYIYTFRVIPIQRAMIGLLYCATLSFLCYQITPSAMRVQWDESDLLATSKGMYLEHADEYVKESIVERGSIIPLYKNQDKRPPLFPFLVSLMHELRGFSIANAFFINLLVLTLLLFTAFQFVAKELNIWAALAAPLLLLASPVVSFCGTSAGFDLLSSLLLMNVAIIAISFVRKPRSELVILWITVGLAYGYSRYESTWVLVGIALAAYFLVRKRWSMDRESKKLLSLFPIFLLPLLLLAHTAKQLLYFEQDTLLAGGDIFSFRYAIDHFFIFCHEFFYPDFFHPYCGVLQSIGLLGIFSALICGVAKREWWIFAAGALLPLLIALSFYYGDATNFTAARLFLPIQIMMSLCPLLLLQVIQRKHFEKLVFFLSLFCFLCSIPGKKIGETLFLSDTSRAIRALDIILSNSKISPQNTLFIFKRPSFFTMRGFASIDMGVFTKIRPRLGLAIKNGDLQNLYFVDIDAPHEQNAMRELLKSLKKEAILNVEKPGISLHIFHLLNLESQFIGQ